jgi:hypothetical protein
MWKALSIATVVALMSFAPCARAQDRVIGGSRMDSVLTVLVIQMPEASSPALLPIDLLAVGALVILFRRRSAHRTSAPRERDSMQVVRESARYVSARRTRSPFLSMG